MRFVPSLAVQWEVRQQILWQACCLWFSRLVPRHSRAAPDLSILVKPLEGEGLPENKSLFPGIIMLDTIVIIIHATATKIGRSSNGGTACATADHFCRHMVNCDNDHLLPVNIAVL